MAPAIGQLPVVLVQLHRGVPGARHDDVRASKDLAGRLVVRAALHEERIDVIPRRQGAVGVQVHPQRGALERRGPALVRAVQVPAGAPPI